MKNSYSITIVIILLLIASVGSGYLIYQGGVKAGALILSGAVGLPVLYGVIAHPRFGILVLLVAAYLIMWIMRMNLTAFPLGTLMDGLLALLILGLFIKQKYKPDWTILKGPISTMIIIWIIYNFLEIINPSGGSRLAWVYTIRSVAIVMLTYFIFSYHIRTREFLRLIIKVWLFLSLFAALYGFKQQHFGFFGFEENYLNSDPLIMNLLFIGGVWRKFSIFSDPVAFSYNMVISALLCIGLMFGPLSQKKKIVLASLAAFFLLNMLYSGTRGAYVLFPAAMVLLAILVFNRKILAITALGGIAILILISIPTSNPALYRFQSAFKPSEDASFSVRANNQKMIQPYIQSHPMGGGLGSTGVWGAKFSPGSFLASFPPDSGYVRVAVELGWIGLFIFCTLMFIILRTGINNYFAIEDPELKSYCLAMTLIVFALNIGNYPQEALVQFPTNIYFYLVVAIINVSMRMDRESRMEVS
jgi:putative inorganic carbon (HCO3(-)) transporter